MLSSQLLMLLLLLLLLLVVDKRSGDGSVEEAAVRMIHLIEAVVAFPPSPAQ
jgi:hypothetical protein